MTTAPEGLYALTVLGTRETNYQPLSVTYADTITEAERLAAELRRQGFSVQITFTRRIDERDI